MTTDRPADALTARSYARVHGGGSRMLYVVAGFISGSFGVGAAVQTSALYRFMRSDAVSAHEGAAELVPRLIVNLVTVAIALLLMAVVRLPRRAGWLLWALLAAIAVVSAAVRILLQTAAGLEVGSGAPPLVVEFVFGFVVVALGGLIGGLLLRTTARLRAEETRSLSQSTKAAAALAALQSEELRVRRDVAEGLHGTVQQRLVLAVARIDEIVGLVGDRASRDEAVELLRSLRQDIDHIRQHDVREMSQMLYPDGLEVGLPQAIRIMMRRVPSTIAVELSIDHAVTEVDGYDGGLDEMRRLNLMRILEEGVSNALKHGRASELRISVCVTAGVLRIEVEDDGSGLPPGPKLNGLGLLEQRLVGFGGRLWLEPSRKLGGALLIAELPVDTAALDAARQPPAVPPTLFD